MKTSDNIAKIADALAKAQAEMGRVVKDKTAKVQTKAGGSYSFDYADLASVLDVVKPALAKHGIAVVQAASLEADKVNVETRLVHLSGEWIESSLAVKPEDVAPQKIGSAITYARRYALSCMVGVASEEDDDGNAAEGNRANVTPRAAAPASRTASVAEKVRAAAKSPPSTPDARKADLKARMLKMGIEGANLAERLGEWIGRTVDGTTVLTADDWTRADTAIEQAIAAGEVLAKAKANGAQAHN